MVPVVPLLVSGVRYQVSGAEMQNLNLRNGICCCQHYLIYPF